MSPGADVEAVWQGLREQAAARRRHGPAAEEPAPDGEAGLLAARFPPLLERIAEKPDLTLYALLGELAKRDVVICCDTLWRFLKHEGISFKKNRVRQRARQA